MHVQRWRRRAGRGAARRRSAARSVPHGDDDGRANPCCGAARTSPATSTRTSRWRPCSKAACASSSATRSMIVSAGESMVVPGGVPHEVEALEDSVVLDVFSPRARRLAPRRRRLPAAIAGARTTAEAVAGHTCSGALAEQPADPAHGLADPLLVLDEREADERRRRRRRSRRPATPRRSPRGRASRRTRASRASGTARGSAPTRTSSPSASGTTSRRARGRRRARRGGTGRSPTRHADSRAARSSPRSRRSGSAGRCRSRART